MEYIAASTNPFAIFTDCEDETPSLKSKSETPVVEDFPELSSLKTEPLKVQSEKIQPLKTEKVEKPKKMKWKKFSDVALSQKETKTIEKRPMTKIEPGETKVKTFVHKPIYIIICHDCKSEHRPSNTDSNYFNQLKRRTDGQRGHVKKDTVFPTACHKCRPKIMPEYTKDETKIDMVKIGNSIFRNIELIPVV
jgi:hypothetical protein